MHAGLICLLGLALAQGSLSTEKPVIEEAMTFPKGDFGGYPDLVSGKTYFLLEEAENMLSRVKVFKERLWLQTFIFKMRKLVSMVKQSIIKMDQQGTEESIEYSRIRSESANRDEISHFPEQTVPMHPTAAVERRRGVRRNYLMASNEMEEKRKIETELGKEILEQIGSSPYEIELGQEEPMALKLLRPYRLMTHGGVQDNSAEKTMAYQIIKLPSTNTSFEDNIQNDPIPPRIQGLLRKLRRENYLLKQRLKAIHSGDKVSNQYHPDLAQNSPYNTNQIIVQRNLYGNPFSAEPPSSNNAKLSDEMKRQLRDGKVIILSHSVVPSHFEKNVVPTQSDVKMQN